MDRGNWPLNLCSLDPVIPFWFVFALQSVKCFVSVLVHMMSGNEGIASYVPLDGRLLYPFLILITLLRVCLKLCPDVSDEDLDGRIQCELDPSLPIISLTIFDCFCKVRIVNEYVTNITTSGRKNATNDPYIVNSGMLITHVLPPVGRSMKM